MKSKANIVPRQHIIMGAQDDTFRMNPLQSEGVQATEIERVRALTSMTSVTAEQLQSVVGNPVRLTPDPASGYAHVIVGVRVTKGQGGYSTPRPLVLRYGEAGIEWGRVPTSFTRRDEAHEEWAAPAVPTWDPPLPPVGGLFATATGDFAGEGGTLDVVVTYLAVESA